MDRRSRGEEPYFHRHIHSVAKTRGQRDNCGSRIALMSSQDVSAAMKLHGSLATNSQLE